MENLPAFFIPIIDIPKIEYTKNKDNIVEYIDSEAKRIKEKGCDLVLVGYKSKKSCSVLLARKIICTERFGITTGFSSIKGQYNCIVKIMEDPNTIIMKEY